MGTAGVNHYIQSTCTCFSYLKQNKCKHIVVLAAFEKLIKIPSTAKSVPIGQKPKQSRPQATWRALVRQPEEATPVQLQVIASHTDTQATTSGATKK